MFLHETQEKLHEAFGVLVSTPTYSYHLSNSKAYGSYQKGYSPSNITALRSLKGTDFEQDQCNCESS